MPPLHVCSCEHTKGMRARQCARDGIPFGVQGRSLGAEVQEAGGSLLTRGTGARSPRAMHHADYCGVRGAQPRAMQHADYRRVQGRIAPRAICKRLLPTAYRRQLTAQQPAQLLQIDIPTRHHAHQLATTGLAIQRAGHRTGAGTLGDYAVALGQQL
jgi:hypothetical protein